MSTGGLVKGGASDVAKLLAIEALTDEGYPVIKDSHMSL
jgi:hypothetical protein